MKDLAIWNFPYRDVARILTEKLKTEMFLKKKIAQVFEPTKFVFVIP